MFSYVHVLSLHLSTCKFLRDFFFSEDWELSPQETTSNSPLPVTTQNSVSGVPQSWPLLFTGNETTTECQEKRKTVEPRALN